MRDLLERPMPPVFGIEELEDMLISMTNNGGSDLFVIGNEEIWLSIFGRKERVTKRKISDNEADMIIVAMYGENAKIVLNTRIPINIQYEFIRKIDTELGFKKKIRYRFRINAVGCLKSGRTSTMITIRSIPTTPPSVKDISVEDEIVHICKNIDQGLILVVGATGNGKSTLLASLLRDQLEDPDGNRHMVTIEHPIEFVYDAVVKPSSFVTPLEVGKHINSFNNGVINSLRMAPSTILVGEARDYETISSCIDASVTGHVVFSTVHANSVAETFQRMISQYPLDMQSQAKFNLVQSCKVIIAQRLIVTVDGKRTAIREYLILNKKIKEKLGNALNIATVAEEMVKKYGKPMVNDVISRYKEGIISKEVYDRQMINYSDGEDDAN